MGWALGQERDSAVIWRWEVSHCKIGHYQCMHASVVNFREIYIRRKISRKISNILRSCDVVQREHA